VRLIGVRVCQILVSLFDRGLSKAGTGERPSVRNKRQGGGKPQERKDDSRGKWVGLKGNWMFCPNGFTGSRRVLKIKWLGAQGVAGFTAHLCPLGGRAPMINLWPAGRCVSSCYFATEFRFPFWVRDVLVAPRTGPARANTQLRC
jgi:hypothetical protein